MSNQQYGIGEHSNSPAGQGCLWLVTILLLVILGSALMHSYKGTPDPLCERLDAGCRAISGKPYKESPYKGSDQ